MTPLRRIIVPLIAIGLMAGASACTGGGDPVTPATASPSSGEGVVSNDTVDTAFVPGRFVYQFNSITAQATFAGSVATMNIRNATGSELGAPSLYVLGADDQRYDGQVQGATAIDDGGQVTLEFMFPDTVTPQTIGLVVLQFGEDNVGAMAPVPKPNG